MDPPLTAHQEILIVTIVPACLGVGVVLHLIYIGYLCRKEMCQNKGNQMCNLI